jgi:hypothetical protein
MKIKITGRNPGNQIQHFILLSVYKKKEKEVFEIDIFLLSTPYMKKSYCIYTALFFIVSCKTGPDSNRDYDKYDPDKTYKLQLNPSPGSSYYYDITNETEIGIEVDGKDAENINKSNTGIRYKIDKDSSGNFLLTMQFDKIHIYTKNNGTEKKADAGNGIMSVDPVEKMLAMLKDATLTSTVSNTGKIRNVTGYKELGEKILAAFPATDDNTKIALESQWDKVIGQGLLRKNLDQLFQIFPDSAVHLRDTWKLTSKQEGDLNMTVKNVYTLKAINSDIAIIESEGKITGDNAETGLMGHGATVISLQGGQQGEYEMEAKTGMLISSRIKADVKGTIRMMGRQVPVRIKTSVKMNGKKEK